MISVVVQADHVKKEQLELEQLLTQSQCIYDLAVNEEWEKVAELESERQNRMNKCFSSQIIFADPQAATCYIQKIIELDRKVIAMGIAAQKILGDALGGLQRGRQAAQVYQKIAS